MQDRGSGFEIPRTFDRGSRFWQTKPGLSKQQSASYQGAFEAVLAVPIAIGIGYWCDGQFDSAPIGLLAGTVIGFAAMLLRIVRMRPPENETHTGEVQTGKESKPGTENPAPERDLESDR